MTDEEIQSILDELNSVRPEKLNGKARKLFDTIMQILDEKDDLKAELHAEKIKNKKLELETIPLLEGKIKQYEQHLDLEWVEDNYVEKRILKRAEKIIDLMAEELINDGDFIGERPSKKSMLEHYYKKVEEENE